MWRLLQSLVDRVKVLLAVRAVAELEAEALASSGGRGTALRRLAAEGLTEVAAELRARADQLDHTGGALTPTVPPPVPALPAPGGRGRRRG
jgi:hypothetical protein